jgi:hypothetical protein
MCPTLSIISTNELKQAIIDQVGNVPDQAPQDVLRHVLDVLEALAKGEPLSSECLKRFLAILDEDRNLLDRLAQ